jgi:glutaredoxin
MITLYVKTGCPFSAKAMAVLDAYGVEYKECNIQEPQYLAELMELGGKKQTPFFVNGDTHFYESDDIVKWVEDNYGDDEEAGTKAPRVHISDAGVCE